MTTPQYTKVDYSNPDYYIDIFNYNPFNKTTPTTGNWKYIKYKPKDDEKQTSFVFPKPTDAGDNNIWVLYGGSGGYGGSSKKGAGGGGGGGSGELKLSLVKKDQFTNIACTIGKLNTQYSIDYADSRNYNYNTTSATTLETKNNTGTTIVTLKATGGFRGDYMNTGNDGGEGGHGANVMIFNGSNLVLNDSTITYNTSNITTISFGSMGGGGGFGNGGSNSRMGDRYRLNLDVSPAQYEYKDETTVQRALDGDFIGARAVFDISLSGVACDGTPNVRILKPGDGGKAAASGSPSEGGFIMFFYKTTTSSFQKYSESQSITTYYINNYNYNVYNYNPFTNRVSYNGDWIYYKYEGSGTTMVNFEHTITNLEGNDVWVLAGGTGGKGGTVYSSEWGSGGGGGPGELVLSVWTKPTTLGVNTTKLGITIQRINQDQKLETIVSYKAKSSDTDYSDVARAYGGRDGDGLYESNNLVTGQATGYNGGQGGYNANAKNVVTESVNVTDTNQVQITTTDTKITTYRFGSGYSGGGEGNRGKGNGELGNQSVVSGTTYQLQVNNATERTGRGCNVDFTKILDTKECDNTGIVELLPGGSGGNTTNVTNNNIDKGSAGYNGPPGFVMIFHKTTVPFKGN
jgi:hypothetical protein